MTAKSSIMYDARLALLCLCMLLDGCASLISSQSAKLADNISTAILDNPDPETVAAAIPAYLVMIDGLIGSNPENPKLLIAGPRLPTYRA